LREVVIKQYIALLNDSKKQKFSNTLHSKIKNINEVWAFMGSIKSLKNKAVNSNVINISNEKKEEKIENSD